MYQNMRDAAVTVIQAIQLDGFAVFQDVKTYPTTEFTGYPAVTVLPGNVSSDYATVAQNERAYSFLIDIHLDLTSSWQGSVNLSLRLIDAVLDALDRNGDLNGTADFLRAAPLIRYDLDDAGQTLVIIPAIELIAIKHVDVR